MSDEDLAFCKQQIERCRHLRRAEPDPSKRALFGAVAREYSETAEFLIRQREDTP